MGTDLDMKTIEIGAQERSTKRNEPGTNLVNPSLQAQPGAQETKVNRPTEETGDEMGWLGA